MCLKNKSIIVTNGKSNGIIRYVLLPDDCHKVFFFQNTFNRVIDNEFTNPGISFEVTAIKKEYIDMLDLFFTIVFFSYTYAVNIFKHNEKSSKS